MSEMGYDRQRRAMLQAFAGWLATGVISMSESSKPFLSAARQDTDGAKPRPTPGKPGDFDFLAGEWKISNRKRKAEGKDEWDEFEGESTCWTVLEGVGSIEELRIPARNFSGIGIRLLDVEKHIWSDFWVNGKSGVLTPPGQTGAFVDGVGTFTARWQEQDKEILVKGVWDQITPKSCRWYQAISRDQGATWEENWIMHWVRK